MKKHGLRSTLLPVFTALIWGTAFVAQDVCAEDVPPMAFNAIRFFIAVLFLAAVKLVIGLFKKKKASSAEERPSVKKLILAGALCGAALCVASNLQQAGMHWGTEAGKSGFITALYVVLVPIGGLLLKRRIRPIFWFAVALAVAGLYLLCLHGSFKFAPGDLLTLLCAAAFTVQILLIDRFAGELDPILFCIAEFLTAAILSAVGMLVFEKPETAPILAHALPILYVAIFSCGVAYLLQIIAQRDGDPTVVSILFSLEAVFSVIASAIILHQRMSAREYAGCALLFAAVLIAQLPGKKVENR